MMTFLFDNDIATVTSLSSLVRHVVFLISANTIFFALHMFIIDVQDSVVRWKTQTQEHIMENLHFLNWSLFISLLQHSHATYMWHCPLRVTALFASRKWLEELTCGRRQSLSRSGAVSERNLLLSIVSIFPDLTTVSPVSNTKHWYRSSLIFSSFFFSK